MYWKGRQCILFVKDSFPWLWDFYVSRHIRKVGLLTKEQVCTEAVELDIHKQSGIEKTFDEWIGVEAQIESPSEGRKIAGKKEAFRGGVLPKPWISMLMKDDEMVMEWRDERMEWWMKG